MSNETRIQQNNIELNDILELITTLPDQKNALPPLTNEGGAADLALGKELINSQGQVVVGTNPYDKSSTDAKVDTISELVTEITTTLEGKAAGGSGVSVETYTGTVYGNGFRLGDIPREFYIYVAPDLTLKAVVPPFDGSVDIEIVAGTPILNHYDWDIADLSSDELIEREKGKMLYLLIPDSNGFAYHGSLI